MIAVVLGGWETLLCFLLGHTETFSPWAKPTWCARCGKPR
jgi:hypothetical protein